MKPPSKRVFWTGVVVSTLVTLFLAFDAVCKVLAIEPVVKASAELGVTAIRPIGLTLLVATVLFALPQTAVLGALLVTAYLGGAVATMVNAGQAFYFPVLFGVVMWAGLAMRRPQLLENI